MLVAVELHRLCAAAGDWPRAPFVIGLVLGKIAEESLHKALDLWGLCSSRGPFRWC